MEISGICTFFLVCLQPLCQAERSGRGNLLFDSTKVGHKNCTLKGSHKRQLQLLKKCPEKKVHFRKRMEGDLFQSLFLYPMFLFGLAPILWEWFQEFFFETKKVPSFYDVIIWRKRVLFPPGIRIGLNKSGIYGP